MADKIVKKYAERVGYSEPEIEVFLEGGHRVRQVNRLTRAASRYSIQAEVVQSKHCNSGHSVGDKIILDLHGNFISEFCPTRMCVYLISQLTVPVALINERISEDLEPNDFHFMRYLRCLDAGVQCYGYGEVTLRVQAIARVKGDPATKVGSQLPETGPD